MRVVLLVIVAIGMLVACGRTPLPPASPLDPPHARAALVEMAFALHASAEDCTTTARWLARKQGDPGAAARADELVDACARGLIPPRDAIYFAIKDADPWTPKAADSIACAGKSLAFALERLRNAIRDAGVTPSSTMEDGLVVALELGALASRRCDPLHPTTTVTVTVDPQIPRVEPTPPGW
jgi:hypothetical protein